MENPEGVMTAWQALAAAADQGQLYLDANAAANCSLACDTYIEQLLGHKRQAMRLTDVDGWGEFEAGRDLRRIFREKSYGGNNSMVDVLQSHIDVVEEMKAVFAKFFVATKNVDQANAADLGSRGPK